MATRRRANAENSQTSASASLGLPSVWQRAFTVKSQWPEKDEFLDVIYWMRQVIAIVFGLIWGLVPLRGILGIALFAFTAKENSSSFKRVRYKENLRFCALNAGILYIYFTSIQQVDEDEFGGPWELTKEGFMSSFALFLVVWIIVYSAVFFD